MHKGINIASKYLTPELNDDGEETNLLTTPDPNPVDQAGRDKRTRWAHQAWIDASRLTREITDEIIRAALPMVLKLSYEVEFSPQCQAGLLQIVQGIRAQDPWAWKCKRRGI